MSALTLIHDEEAVLLLEPVDTAESPESISFDVSFDWQMPFQTCKIRVRQCWILADALREFEQSLCEILRGQAGAAILSTMDERELLSVTLDGNTASVSISASDTTQMGECSFRMNTYRPQVSGMYERLRNYAKWW